eukprot:5427650-Prymnesium_polylepis.2
MPMPLPGEQALGGAPPAPPTATRCAKEEEHTGTSLSGTALRQLARALQPSPQRSATRRSARYIDTRVGPHAMPQALPQPPQPHAARAAGRDRADTQR